jgi:hypothetical protein
MQRLSRRGAAWSTALGTLKYGEATLTAPCCCVDWRNPDELNITLGGLERLPEAYSLITEIEAEDDGTPLRLCWCCMTA